jgi:hypothetical protein
VLITIRIFQSHGAPGEGQQLKGRTADPPRFEDFPAPGRFQSDGRSSDPRVSAEYNLQSL